MNVYIHFLQICISVNCLLLLELDVNTIIPLTLILTLEEICLRQLFRVVILSDCLEDNVNKRVSVVVTSSIHTAGLIYVNTVCQRSLDPFYILSYYMKWVVMASSGMLTFSCAILKYLR